VIPSTCIAQYPSTTPQTKIIYPKDNEKENNAADMSTTPAPPEDQARLLEDALIAVRQQTVLMRKCLDTPGKLMDALKCWWVQSTLT
jgi:hypothetical protein